MKKQLTNNTYVGRIKNVNDDNLVSYLAGSSHRDVSHVFVDGGFEALNSTFCSLDFGRWHLGYLQLLVEVDMSDAPWWPVEKK